MKHKVLMLSAASILASLSLSSCSHMGNGVALSIPPAIQAAEKAQKTIYISNVVDCRSFHVPPCTPDVPSLASSELPKNKVIGRNRSGYGKACGNVSLKDAETIEKLVGNLAGNTFASLGYNVALAKPKGRVIDAKIKITDFWGWVSMPRGSAVAHALWSFSMEQTIKMNAKIGIALEVKLLNGKKVNIKAASYVTDTPFVGMTNGEWTKLFNTLLANCSEELKAKVKTSKL